MNPTQPTPEPTPSSAPVPAETAAPPVITPSPVVTPPAFAPAQPVVEYDPKAVSRVKLIAKVVITLSVIGILSSILSDDGIRASSLFSPFLVLNILTVIVGIGLLKFNKIAYHAFNVIAILSVLGGILGAFSIPFAIAALPLIFAFNPFMGLLTLLTVVASVGSTIFMIWALIALHPRSVRQLFH